MHKGFNEASLFKINPLPIPNSLHKIKSTNDGNWNILNKNPLIKSYLPPSSSRPSILSFRHSKTSLPHALIKTDEKLRKKGGYIHVEKLHSHIDEKKMSRTKNHHPSESACDTNKQRQPLTLRWALYDYGFPLVVERRKWKRARYDRTGHGVAVQALYPLWLLSLCSLFGDVEGVYSEQMAEKKRAGDVNREYAALKHGQGMV